MRRDKASSGLASIDDPENVRKRSSAQRPVQDDNSLMGMLAGGLVKYSEANNSSGSDDNSDGSDGSDDSWSEEDC
jgi:hypothetical protein